MGETKESPEFHRLGPFTVSLYHYYISPMEHGWNWRVSGRVGNDEPFKTKTDAKWDLCQNIWELISPLRLWAQKRKKAHDARRKDSD